MEGEDKGYWRLSGKERVWCHEQGREEKDQEGSRRTLRIQYKCLVHIYVFPEIKLCSLLVSQTEL
jgi:hypothetical protein